VVAISGFAADEIRRAYALPEPRVAVTPLAVIPEPDPGEASDGARTLERCGLRTPYLVSFSSSFAHKNIPRLIEAFARAKASRGLPHHLVVIGHRPSRGIPPTLPPDVHFTGFLLDREVKQVLRRAEMLVFPSTYEGFGLPVLEAMAAGLPVACSRVASLPEVAGDAALFFDPYSVEEIADRIARLATDAALREQLRARGRDNLLRFSWEETARRTLAVYREALSGLSPERMLRPGEPSGSGIPDGHAPAGLRTPARTEAR
jgi:glycosyltransferase involved in cell wall biosynthesis